MSRLLLRDDLAEPVQRARQTGSQVGRGFVAKRLFDAVEYRTTLPGIVGMQQWLVLVL